MSGSRASVGGPIPQISTPHANEVPLDTRS